MWFHNKQEAVLGFTYEWWKAGLAAAPPQQTPSAAAGMVLCDSWGAHCRSLAPLVRGTLDMQS